ncbi:MAG: lytic transglycosylase domain-containing protein, partial [Alphaproteobacteria bacterium]|nr:lytic transglycosylase domain-containing protein [Alphaproteobacteria bacterium]
FAELLATARRESGLKTDAKNPNTSATGLFQFTEQTWLELVRRHGAKYGMGDAAAKIARDPATGRNEVPSVDDRSAILALRKDAKLAAAMAGELSKTNRSSLQKALGREPTYQEVYAAHFLGASGAVRLIKAAEANPDQPANRVLPVAAKANRAGFHDRDAKRARTAGETRQRPDLAAVTQTAARVCGAEFTEGIVVARGRRPDAAPNALAAQLQAQLSANDG